VQGGVAGGDDFSVGRGGGGHLECWILNFGLGDVEADFGCWMQFKI
jgi:hypothetical protein